MNRTAASFASTSRTGYPWEVFRYQHSLVLFVPLIVGCSYYDYSLLEPKPTVFEDAGQEASAEAGQDVALDNAIEVSDRDEPDTTIEDVEVIEVAEANETSVCQHARPPEPPTVSAGGGGIEFTVAVYDVDFGDIAGNPKEIGYDLDSRCTCLGEGSSCLREAWATADACDGPDGRDNATGIMMTKLAALFGSFSSTEWSANAKKGIWSMLLRVRDYNGEANDDRVRLEWFVPSQFSADKADNDVEPVWDGSDAWPIRSESLEAVDGGEYSFEKPKYFDTHAYVTEGILVGSFPESVFQIDDDYALDFTGSFITARIESTAQGWMLTEGLLASRWALSSILAQIGRLHLMNKPVCTDHIAYPELKREFCSYADIYSGVGTPTTPCDSVSLGMRFEARPALLGTIIIKDPSERFCDPSVDPAFDHCGN